MEEPCKLSTPPKQVWTGSSIFHGQSHQMVNVVQSNRGQSTGPVTNNVNLHLVPAWPWTSNRAPFTFGLLICTIRVMCLTWAGASKRWAIIQMIDDAQQMFLFSVVCFVFVLQLLVMVSAITLTTFPMAAFQIWVGNYYDPPSFSIKQFLFLNLHTPPNLPSFPGSLLVLPHLWAFSSLSSFLYKELLKAAFQSAMEVLLLSGGNYFCYICVYFRTCG